MLQYLFSPTKQFTYESGKLLDGGKIYVYIKDTTTLATLYDVDEDYVSNPIILDANGRASVKADDTYEYRLEIYTNRDVLLYTCNAFCDGGDGEGSLSVVRHDETLSGNGTSQSLLGVVNIPLAVDETMTAYTADVDEKESLVLGVNGDWFNDTFGSALNTKVDWSAFSSCCSAVKGRLDNKLDISAFDLSNYYNKQEINNALDLKLDRSEFYNNISGFQTKLEFGYDENSAISSINNSALAGQGGDGNCPWISGTKVIADTQTLTSNMIIQVLSSFTMSGDHNHFIGMKGGTYRFPNEYEIGSALLHTNYFMHLSGMSAYLPISSFSSYTASIANNLENNWNYTNSAYSLSINNLYNKVDWSAFSSYSAQVDPAIINNITEQITNISNASGNWNDISAYQQNSANYLTAINIPESASWNEATTAYQANSGTYLTEHQSLEDYYKKTETSSKGEIADALSNIPQGDPQVNNFVQTNSSTIVNVDNVVQSNSAQWAENTGDTEVNNYVYNNSGINNEVNNVVTANSGAWNNVTNKLDTTAFTAWSSTIFSGDYELSAGDGIALVDDVQNKITRIDFTGTSGPDLSAGEGIEITTNGGKTVITNNISAGPGISLVYDVESNKIRIDGEGREYSGVAPISVDNVNNQISISGESLSAGPGINIFESGGYVVISAGNDDYNFFPMTGADGTSNYTANANFSSFTLTTGQGAAGCYINLDAKNVRYEAYPSTDVSASWYNIINGANNRSNCYCIRFTNDMTAADLADYSAYDKVTVVHSNEYTPDCNLYWDGNTKVFPSGLYCELVKGTNDQNQIDWFFTTSGWTNNLWWDWD